MKFHQTPIEGLFVVEPNLIADDRGFFARTWCQDEAERHGLNSRVVQCNISFNRRKGTLRGMHFQNEPHAEAKLVRCSRGKIFDVALDLRRDSPTFRRWHGVELTEENRMMFFIPEGIAHGFQTLEDQTEVFYQMSEFYHSDFSSGVRWDDPAFAIRWPLADPILSERDRSYPDFK